MDVARLLQALRERGIVSQDLRQAVHEACHALDFDLKPPWTRPRVSAAMDRPDMVGQARAEASEVLARAVERIVCLRYGVHIADVESLASKSSQEFWKDGLTVDATRLAARISVCAGSKHAAEMADRVVGLCRQ